ncbi:ATP-dependent DNA helicase [Arachnia propionica]|uniref:ATP-dependent DNA helicase n=1 Tax=Arachnia propionica TaxID=1750 RepID=UPI00163AB6BF|nr:ATP-dependent DNA helicase [Arachnia propionica]
MTAFTQPEDVCRATGIPFSQEQLEVICSPLEPQVIVAGAGTGKTTVMAARVVWLVGSGQVRPEQVLGLTFTRKAAAELGARVAQALTRGGLAQAEVREEQELVLTYDAFAGRIVQEHGIRLGREQGHRMLTGASRFRLAQRVIEEFDRPLPIIERRHATVLPERLLDLDAAMGAHLVSPERVREFTRQSMVQFEAAPTHRGNRYKVIEECLAAAEERLQLLELVEAYRGLKASIGVVEFADQLASAVEVARYFAPVRAALRERFKVVLLDEYQDTSSAQAELLRTLFSGPDPERGRGFPVTAVGDPNQAIYGWRGAAASNILDFPLAFPRSDGTPATRWSLTINRRSGTNILAVGNALAEPLRQTVGGGVSLVAPDGVGPGTIVAHGFDTEDEELDHLAQDVLGRHATGVAWRDMAVLTRRNELLGRVWQRLRDRDIPVEIVGLGGLLHLPEIAPVVATLKILADPLANAEVAGLLTGERWQVGLDDLGRLAERARELVGAKEELLGTMDVLEEVVVRSDPVLTPSLLDAALDPGERLSPEGTARVRQFAAEISRLLAHRLDPVPELVTRVIAMLGLETEMLIEGDTSQLARFVAACASSPDLDQTGNLAGLLAWLDAEDLHGDGLERALPSEADSVKLLSVHRAKGLEWETVYLPALSQGVFPSQDRSGNWTTNAAMLPSPLRGDALGIPQLLEYSKQGIDTYKDELKQESLLAEDRLAYVAATRARSHLQVSCHHWAPGRRKASGGSRYHAVAEALADTVTRSEVSDTNPVPVALRQAAWPGRGDPVRREARQRAARLVEEARHVEGDEEWVWRSGIASRTELERIATWDAEAAFLAEQAARREIREVLLPDGLSASAMMELAADPEAFAERLARRMPREPRAEALLGQRFHDWVVSRYRESPGFDELVASPAPDPALLRLQEAFERSRFAHLQPLGVEVPFLLDHDGLILRGRIDAVFPAVDDSHDVLIVDWKIGNADADPLQLAIYRQAWAEASGVPSARVATAFHHVMGNRTEFVAAPPSLIAAAADVLRT